MRAPTRALGSCLPSSCLRLVKDTMYASTPPAAELTRLRLRHVAAWIRDELDPVIAREGPEILRADDVLTLHEVFYSLRVSHTITALDLRATGIHRAVMEVAGKATRWPGRLADDCDRIIIVWKRKFGPLQDLRPFICGRAGRLEGVASATEFSKAVRLFYICVKNILLTLGALVSPSTLAKDLSRQNRTLPIPPEWGSRLQSWSVGLLYLPL
jgi:hypothetical protein